MGAPEFEWPVPRDSSGDKSLLENPAEQATSRTGLLEGQTAHSLQIVNRETCLDNSSSLPKPNVQPLGPEENTHIFLNCNMIIKVIYQISKILIV